MNVSQARTNAPTARKNTVLTNACTPTDTNVSRAMQKGMLAGADLAWSLLGNRKNAIAETQRTTYNSFRRQSRGPGWRMKNAPCTVRLTPTGPTTAIPLPGTLVKNVRSMVRLTLTGPGTLVKAETPTRGNRDTEDMTPTDHHTTRKTTPRLVASGVNPPQAGANL